MGRIQITPDVALSELSPEHSAMLILPGAETWQDAQKHREPHVLDAWRGLYSTGDAKHFAVMVAA